jgi:hypothetical protein
MDKEKRIRMANEIAKDDSNLRVGEDGTLFITGWIDREFLRGRPRTYGYPPDGGLPSFDGATAEIFPSLLHYAQSKTGSK